MPTLEDKTASALEDDFINGLDDAANRADELIAIVAHVHETGDAERAAEWADLLQDAVATLDDTAPGFRLWELRCGWNLDNPAFRSISRKVVETLFKADVAGTRFVRNVGYDNGLPLAECVRRMKLLTCLKPGVLCYNKTWGAGLVVEIDGFYEKVRIDFDRKKSHEIAFSYAVESLEVLPADHLLYMKHHDPEGMAAMIVDTPDEIVRRALGTWGAITVQQLQSLLTEHIIAPDGWKRFWDAARRGLKKDALVVIPSKRTEVIRILATAKAYDEAWFSKFSRNSDLDEILVLVPELLSQTPVTELEPAWLEICQDRLRFVIRGTRGREKNLTARAIVLACRLGLQPCEWEEGQVLDEIVSPAVLLKDLATFPIKDLHVILEYMLAQRRDAFADTMLGALPRMHLVLLSDVLELLRGDGFEERCADVFRAAFNARVVSAEFLVWLSKRLDLMKMWGIGSPALLPPLGIDALRIAETGERLKGQNQLVEVFGDRVWLQGVLEAMSVQERKDLVIRIQREVTAVMLDKAMVTARIIHLYPALQDALINDSKEEERAAARRRYTSWRTLRARQEELRNIVEVEVPANSREIALARSYGDLKENHEYKAAKEQQALLMQRQAVMEQDLREVQGTDFAGFRTDEAGTGTIVTIERPDGAHQTFCVLGEWDRDEALQIISCESFVGQTLKGHSVGDDVSLPGANGDENCRIIEVFGLTDDVKVWVQG